MNRILTFSLVKSVYSAITLPLLLLILIDIDLMMMILQCKSVYLMYYTKLKKSIQLRECMMSVRLILLLLIQMLFMKHSLRSLFMHKTIICYFLMLLLQSLTTQLTINTAQSTITTTIKQQIINKHTYMLCIDEP